MQLEVLETCGAIPLINENVVFQLCFNILIHRCREILGHGDNLIFVIMFIYTCMKQVYNFSYLQLFPNYIAIWMQLVLPLVLVYMITCDIK